MQAPDHTTKPASIAEVDARLARLEWTRSNRIALTICLVCGVALSVDMLINLTGGEPYQYVRHSFGPVLIAAYGLLLVKTAREAGAGYRELAQLMLADMKANERERILARLPFRRLGALHFSLGASAARRLLTRTLRRTLRATERSD